jgi:hypothetical protein
MGGSGRARAQSRRPATTGQSASPWRRTRPPDIPLRSQSEQAGQGARSAELVRDTLRHHAYSMTSYDPDPSCPGISSSLTSTYRAEGSVGVGYVCDSCRYLGAA